MGNNFSCCRQNSDEEQRSQIYLRHRRRAKPYKLQLDISIEQPTFQTSEPQPSTTNASAQDISIKKPLHSALHTPSSQPVVSSDLRGEYHCKLTLKFFVV